MGDINETFFRKTFTSLKIKFEGKEVTVIFLNLLNNID